MNSKSKTKFWQRVASLLLTALITFNCAVPAYAWSNRHPSEELTSASRSVTLEVGERKLLSILYILYPWSSSDNSIVSVHHGIVTGQSEGTATVTVRRLLLWPISWDITVEDPEQHTEHIWDKGDVTTPATCSHEGSITYTCIECGSTMTETIPIDTENHESVKTETINASCEESGSERVFCEACGVTLSETEIPATGHSWNEGMVNEVATCTHEGTLLYTCAKCYETRTEAVPVDPKNHEQLQTETVDVTCTEDGSQRVYCTACDTVLSETTIPAIGHDWDNGVVTEENTCLTEGTLTYTCQNCGGTYEESLPVDSEKHINLREEETEGTCTVGATHRIVCEDCGTVIEETAEPAPGHTEEEVHLDPTETENGYDRIVCSVCGEILSETVIPATGHEWDEGVVTTEATCVAEGVLTYTCKGCDATYTEPIPIDPENHVNIVTETTEPTCTVDGKTVTHCADCGLVMEETEIPATGHSWVEEETIPATCSSTGLITYSCENCNETKEETLALDPDNHINSNIETTDATCTESGSVTTKCTDCGAVLEEVEIPALGHSWGEGSVTTEATCSHEGIMTYTCSVCGETQEETLPLNASNHDNIITDRKEATCTEAGYETTYCNSCDTVISHTELQPTGHAWDEGAVTEEATCVAEGTILYTCTVCGETYENSIPVDSTKHTNVQEETTEATCTEIGKTVVFCADCNAVISETEIPATGHTETEEHKDATATEDGYDRVVCTVCGEVLSETIIPATGEEPEEDEHLVYHLVVQEGIATDLVSGTTYSGIEVTEDGYLLGGTVTLPKSYTNWTFQMIADYNEESTSGIIRQIRFTSNSGKYEECSNVFLLNETSLISNRGSIRIPWVRDSWNTGYVVTIPVQLYAHVSADYEFLPTGDIFWSFSMDSDNGTLLSRIDGATATSTMSTFTDDDGSTKYVDKILPSSFTLTGAHKVKEIKIYDTPLTAEEMEADYEATGITPPTSGISVVSDGLTDMGSSYYFSREYGGYVEPIDSETEAGTYTVEDRNGRTLTYEITDFVQPENGIDNSVYEGVHITNEPETLETGKQYPLSAYPYPFSITGEDGKADEFDVEWSSSDSSVISVIDGLLIAKKPGTVEITATLMGTDMSDTVIITVADPEVVEDIVWYVPSDYESSDGDSFSDTDYEMTTRAIYAAIDEAAANGYNHIVFPQQDFYAVPLENGSGGAYRYYVPSNMTIEFPEGSAFYMMDNELSRGDPTKVEIHYFDFGVPNNDYTGVCEDSHLIMDKYYGERYNTTHSESEYLEEMRFVNIGRKAINCSVEIREAYYPAGYFIVVDGTNNVNRSSGVMNTDDFVSGWLDDNGELQENSNWISTTNFITVPDYGTDGYFISAHGQDSYAGKYWGGCSARVYDILWFDADYNAIQIDRFQGRGEYYDIPEDAVYFKVSLQQSSLPEVESKNTPWIAMHDDGSAKFCEIKNTRVYNSATGIFSVVGETDGLWVHHCYTNRDGMKPLNGRTGDFENGWTAMRHSVVSNNSLNGYFGNPGGFNTFFHTNFITNYSGFTGETEMLRYINNTTDFIEISEKSQAHIYYNTIYSIGIDRFSTSIGYVYHLNNTTGKWVRSY